MKYKLTTLLFAVVFSSISFAVDIDAGKDMYDEDCTKCHDSSVFTRKNRKVNNIDTLKNQVHRCVTSQAYSWFEEDEENVTAYLNDAYYKFSKTTITE